MVLTGWQYFTNVGTLARFGLGVIHVCKCVGMCGHLITRRARIGLTE